MSAGPVFAEGDVLTDDLPKVRSQWRDSQLNYNKTVGLTNIILISQCDADDTDIDEHVRRWKRNSPALATQSSRRALQNSWV